MLYDPLDVSDVPKDALGRVFVETSYVQRAFELLDALIAEPRTVSHAWGYAIIGAARCGKTTLAKEYLRVCRDEVGGRKPLKVLWVQLTPDSRLSHIAEATLDRLGDPNPGYGSQQQKTERVIAAIRRANFDLLVFDEAHHLVDSDTKRVQSKGASWFSQLLDQARKPMLIIGYDLFDSVLNDNQFLEGRLLPFPPIRAYRHDVEEDLAEFSGVLELLDENMGLPALSGLGEPDTALRICVTCLGKLGLVERFLTHARNLARIQKHSALTHEILRDTADAVVRSWATARFNAFNVPDIEAALKKEGLPIEHGKAARGGKRK
jgi:hypothetical protein